MKPQDLKRFANFLVTFLLETYGSDYVDKAQALDEAHLEYACQWDTDWEWREIDQTALAHEVELTGIYYDEDLDCYLA